MSKPIMAVSKKGSPEKDLEDKLSTVLTTDKQKAFLKNRMAGMNKRQAAIQAGYAPSTASLMAKRLTDKLACNRYFMEEAQRQGLTIEAIIGELKRGVTEAMHPLHPDQPDNYNRRGYTDLAMKLFGAYAPTKVDIDIQKKEATIIITPEIIDRLERYERQSAALEALGHIVPDPPKEKTPF
ncbi:MAG: hypothetical protein E4G99_02125 [Anaerolineales bacterium]|nr:MAG: hypothetical protein E4G99_02125 [Anaerolineales bacterium]